LTRIRKYYILEELNIIMKHDSESQIQPITTDPITGEYKLTIPEWMINEYGWYEGQNLEWFLDIDGIHILEEENE